MEILGQAGRVGTVVVLAVALVIGMLFWFRGGLLRHTYTIDVLFADASGAEKDSPVTLAGVQIGKVKQIRLTTAQKADLTLELQDRIAGRAIRIPSGSAFSIVTPILGSTGNVVVTPPPDAAAHSNDVIRPGAANLVGQSTPDVNAAFAKANVLLTQLTATTRRSDKLIDTLTRTAISANTSLNGPQVQGTLGNLNRASANGVYLTQQLSRTLTADNAQLLTLLHRSGLGTQTALNNIDATTARFNTLAAQNQGKLNEIVSNLRDTTDSLSGITDQVNETLKEGNAPQNIGAVIKNLKTASDNLVLISSNFAKLSGDQGIQEDLRETLHNVRASSEQTTYLLERLNQIAGTREHPAVVIPGTTPAALPPGGTPPVQTRHTLLGPALLPRLDALQNLRTRHFRTDLDAVLPIRGSAPGAFARVGVYGFGDTNQPILEYGAALDPNGLFDARAGLYNAKLSVGADVGLGRRETLSLDAWDPNRLHLDTRAVWMFGSGFGLLLGDEDVLRHASPTIGLEYRR